MRAGVRKAFLSSGLALTLMTSGVFAQGLQLPSSPLTIEQAIQFGIENYPSVRTSLARVQAAKSGVDLTRTAYLPRMDMGYQGSVATFNNVSGLFFPAPFIPPISGPDLKRNSYSGAWGSATGAIAAWEPFDFGLRNANVESARAAERQMAAGVNLTRLDVGMGVADAFIQVLVITQTVDALRGNVERRRIFAETVAVLVKSGLRPGVDDSRAKAELAAARTLLIQAEQAKEIARATLAEVLGVAGEQIDVQVEPLLSLPTSHQLPDSSPTNHPLAVVQKATAEMFQKRKEALDRAWVPRFNLQAGLFSRGSGWDNQGDRQNGLGPLFPDIPNWAGGLTVSFALMDFASIRAQRSIELHNEEAESSAYDQVLQALTSKHVKAVETVKGARRVAENTPIQLSAAKDTETQARTRYRTGLATVVEVAEAQQLVVQATIDDAVARLGVWRALLGLANAQGDIGLFLNLVKAAEDLQR